MGQNHAQNGPNQAFNPPTHEIGIQWPKSGLEPIERPKMAQITPGTLRNRPEMTHFRPGSP